MSFPSSPYSPPLVTADAADDNSNAETSDEEDIVSDLDNEGDVPSGTGEQVMKKASTIDRLAPENWWLLVLKTQ